VSAVIAVQQIPNLLKGDMKPKEPMHHWRALVRTEDLEDINKAASKIPIHGERLPESILRMSYR
jgi:hypothetical protein